MGATLATASGFSLHTQPGRQRRSRSQAEATAKEYDRAVETEPIFGQPAKAVVSYVDERDGDRIVVGSGGKSGPTRGLLGSVAETVTRRASGPATIVR